MKRHVLMVLVVAALGAMAVGCVGYAEYLNRSFKPNMNSFTRTRYNVEEFEVLGVVTAEGESLCVLGVYVGGEEGQALLWERARERYGDNVTGIKDVSARTEYVAVLPPIFSKVKTIFVGTAVHEE